MKIIQITAGRGPLECQWVVAKVLKFLITELVKLNIQYEILAKVNGSENGTVQSVTIQLKGKELQTFLSKWLGTIQWVGTSTFRKHHKRKNWFVGCFELDGVQEIKFSENDISFQAIRSSGPGGQHVNKVSSAIRAKHIPTGIQVVASDSRSQHQNKKLAIERLKQAVQNETLKGLQQQVENQWEQHLNLQRGNPVKVFRGTDFKTEKKTKRYKKERSELKKSLRKLDIRNEY